MTTATTTRPLRAGDIVERDHGYDRRGIVTQTFHDLEPGTAFPLQAGPICQGDVAVSYPNAPAITTITQGHGWRVIPTAEQTFDERVRSAAIQSRPTDFPAAMLDEDVIDCSQAVAIIEALLPDGYLDNIDDDDLPHTPLDAALLVARVLDQMKAATSVLR